VEPARGKTVRYSGYIKTEDLTGGCAGLWWRVDAANQPAIAFDNMQTTGPKGTTEWTRYQIELPVSKDATNINFGVLMPGQGRAWFDELRVEIDGEPYSDSEKFDFDFEWDKIEGYYASQGGAYEARLDDEVFYSGSQSLCLESAVSAEEAQDAVDAVAVSKAVFDAMEASRERYTGETTIEETDWAIHNARIVNQSMRLKQQNLRAIRDEAMADNIAWILEHNPGAKIVLWAHNGHVGRDRGAMGGYLDEMFGDDYVPVGFIAGHGVYRAFDSDHRALAENPLADPPSGSIESYFEATGADRLIVDLRRSDAQSQVAAWPTETRMSRSIGAVAAQEQFYPVAVTEHYDILVYFRDTTASVPIRK
jgi:hypothetical protein